MQPAQLSLLPDQVPAPLASLLVQLPEPQVAAAIVELAGLIAALAETQSLGEVGDE